MPAIDLHQALSTALQLFNRDALTEAETICRQVLEADSGNTQSLHLLGLIADRQGRPDTAMELIQQALAHAPARADFHRNLGMVLKHLGRVEDAVASYHRASELSQEGSDERRELGRALDYAARAALERLQRGDWRAALSICHRVLEIAPDHADVLHLCGVTHGEAGDIEQALALIGRAIELRPDEPSYHTNRGLLCRRALQHDEALRHFEAASRLSPDSAAAWTRLGSACQRVGRLYDAVVAWERAWDALPDDGALYHALWAGYQEITVHHLPPGQLDGYVGAVASGNTARAAGQTDAAEAFYRAALQARPDAPFARSQLGCLLAAERRYAAAGECFRLLARKFPYPNEVIRFDADHLSGLADRHRDPGYPQLVGDLNPTRKDVVVLIAGDARYFRTYAYPLVNSLLANSALECLIHLHLVNPDEFIPDEIEFIRRELDCPDLAYTFERYAFPGRRDGARPEARHAARTYYACSRFLRVPDLLEHYGRPVLMLDLDVLVVNDLRPLLEATAGFDGGLIALDPKIQHVWDQIYATLICLQPTPRSHAFLARVADYIWHHLARGRMYWGLDQIAWYAVSATAGMAQAPRFHDFPRRIAQGTAFYGKGKPEYADDACIWTITASKSQNKAKLDLPEYRRYLPRIKRVFGWYLPGTDRTIEEALESAPAREGRRLWKADLERACLERRPRRRRALDIGAHAGLWSWMLSASFERVDALETDALLQECWRRNVDSPNAVLHPRAPGSPTRIDDLPFDGVDFIRVTAAGDEELVLQDAQVTLLRDRPLVLLEPGFSNPHCRLSDGAAVRYLETLGARVVSEPASGGCFMDW